MRRFAWICGNVFFRILSEASVAKVSPNLYLFSLENSAKISGICVCPPPSAKRWGICIEWPYRGAGLHFLTDSRGWGESKGLVLNTFMNGAGAVWRIAQEQFGE